MKIERAIELIKMTAFFTTKEFNEAKGMAISALEKQMPKKPVSFKRTAHDFQSDTCKYSGCYCEHIKPFNHEYQYTDYKCPACGKLLSDGTPGYCWHCGQTLDWSDKR